jgi:hypothetical protein
MSFRPVLGRSSARASVRTMPSYSGSITSSTTARPSRSSTSPMSPIRTPDTRTVWPWPAVTAWAVENSAFSRSGASSHGKRRRCWSST